MPEIGGLELLAKAQEDFPEVVRIVLSGFSQVSTIIEAVNSGDIYRYITKPWKIDENSKKIIKDALEYSEFIKQKNRDEYISIDQLRTILEKIDCDFEIGNGENLIKINKKYSLKKKE